MAADPSSYGLAREHPVRSELPVRADGTKHEEEAIAVIAGG